jgi:hypothetical protein
MRLTCGFAKALAAVWDEVSGFHWGLDGTVVLEADRMGRMPPDGQELYAMFELQGGEDLEMRSAAVWEYAWLKPGTLRVLSEFVRGDWTYLAGFHTLPCRREEAKITDPSWLLEWADISFVCIDAAFWEVSAQRPALLTKLIPFGVDSPT